MPIETPTLYFLFAFFLRAVNISLSCIAAIRFFRIFPAWNSAVASATGESWLRQAFAKRPQGDWSHPAGMFAILFISALSGIASGIQLFSNGTSRTASEWLSCSGVDLAVSLALWTLLPAATAAAVAILGKAAEPSASPIRLAMDDFDARKRERLLAESERAGLEAEITTPTNRSPSAYGRRL